MPNRQNYVGGTSFGHNNSNNDIGPAIHDYCSSSFYHHRSSSIGYCPAAFSLFHRHRVAVPPPMPDAAARPACGCGGVYCGADSTGVDAPTFVHRRNERERERVRCVNDGYACLRQHLPLENKDKRVSKVETLRFAIRYIRRLQEMLAETPTSSSSAPTTKSPSPDARRRNDSNHAKNKCAIRSK